MKPEVTLQIAPLLSLLLSIIHLTRANAGTIIQEREALSDQDPFRWRDWATADKPASTFRSQVFAWTRKDVDAGPFGTYTLLQIPS